MSTSKTESDAELRKRISKALNDCFGMTYIDPISRPMNVLVDFVKAERTALLAEVEEKQNPWDFVEPCEPDCTPERHAYHAGMWNMAQRMSGSDFPTDAQLEKGK